MQHPSLSWRLFMFILVFTIALGGCVAPEAAVTSGATTGDSAGTESAEEVNAGGTLVTGALLGIEPRSLNPNFRRDDGSLRIAALVYCQLVAGDYTHGTGNYPELAESWEVSEDATEYTFNLIQNATWHNGTPVTSADVAWTFQEIIDKEGGAAPYLSTVASIETPDDFTVKITLSEPNAAFVSGLGAFYGPKIMPKALYEGTDWTTNPNNDNPVGCGPYKFDEWERGSFISVVANEDYYRGRPLLDRIVMRFYPIEGLISAFESGEVKYSYENFPFTEASRLQQDPRFCVEANPVPLVYWFGFNLSRAPFDDVRVRQAIAHAINREDISERVFLGYAQPSYGTAPKGWAYNPDAEVEYNIDEAIRLLEEAGFTPDANGVRLRATITVASVMSFPDVVTVIKEQLKEIGVELEIETMDFAAYTAKVTENRDFDIAGGGGLAGPDPNEFAPFVSSDGYRNIMGYSNPRVDELFVEGRQAPDQEERKTYYQEIQGILVEDMPRITVLDSVSAFPHWCEVKNVYFDEALIGKPSNVEYSFLYTYLDPEE